MKKLLQKLTPEKSSGNYLKEALENDEMTLIEMLHGYIYMRWPKAYIGAAMGKNRLTPLFDFIAGLMGANQSPEKREQLKKDFADSYHGKAVPLEDATKLVTLNRPVNTTVSEKVLPYTRARDIVIKNPDHIVLLECPCRASVENPCKPLDVCIIIGDPFASFITKHHPDKSRRITQDEAIRVLEAEDARGHVHHAFFKDVMLGRFYAICNCCTCCCGAMQAWRNGVPMLASSGYVSQVDMEQCLGCGMCVDFCQFGAISMNEGQAVIDTDQCMGCGVCASKCTQEAISLVRMPGKGEPLEIQQLIASASKSPEGFT